MQSEAAETPLGRMWRHESRRNVSALVHVWRRLELVERLMASGTSPSRITQRLLEECHCSRREANRYQAAVRRRWLTEADREDHRQELIKIKRALWLQVDSGDAKAAVAALRVLADMAGARKQNDDGMASATMARPMLAVSVDRLSAEMRSRQQPEDS